MPGPEPDPYATLGVGRSATLLEIARARRRLAKRHHPDLSSDSAAAQRMRDINEAWDILSSPRARAAWDALHAGLGMRPPGVVHVRPEWGPARVTPPPPKGGIGGWVALVLVTVLLVGIMVAGVVAGAQRPRGDGPGSPGYHGNLP
jgi:hypothetical protein